MCIYVYMHTHHIAVKSDYPSINPHIYLSIHPSIYLSFYLSICHSIILSFYSILLHPIRFDSILLCSIPSIDRSIFPSIYLSIYFIFVHVFPDSGLFQGSLSVLSRPWLVAVLTLGPVGVRTAEKWNSACARPPRAKAGTLRRRRRDSKMGSYSF